MEHIEHPTDGYSKKRVASHKENKHSQSAAVLSIATIPLIMTLGNSMLIPVLPVIENQLGITNLQSSLIITVYSVVPILLIPIAGYLSDRLGRKMVMIPSLIISGIGGLLAGWASWKMSNPYYMILIGRILQGVGASGAFPIVLPLVGDMFRQEEEVSATLGVIETSNTLGKVLSPILGSLLAGWIWFMPFFSFPLFCLVSIVLLLIFVKNPKRETENKESIHEFIQIVKEIFQKESRWLYAIFAIGIILMFVLFGFQFYLSSILEDQFHTGGIMKGFLLAIPLAALCFASYITGKYIKGNKKTMKWTTTIGLAVTAISLCLVLISDQLWYILGVFVICGIGIGAGLPCMDAMITSSIEKEERGTITSMYSSMRFAGVAAGPPVSSILMKNSEFVMFFLLAFLCLVAAAFSMKAIEPNF
ncbi:MAG: MFS transporter [Bacillales bacterium]|nr:MFS transporter [Bacillales bacterium]